MLFSQRSLPHTPASRAETYVSLHLRKSCFLQQQFTTTYDHWQEMQADGRWMDGCRGVSLISTLVETKSAPNLPPPKHTQYSNNIGRDTSLLLIPKFMPTDGWMGGYTPRCGPTRDTECILQVYQ